MPPGKLLQRIEYGGVYLMSDIIIIGLLAVITVLAVVILVTVRRPAEEDDDSEAVQMFLDKLDENKEAVQKVSVQFDMMSKNQYVQNKAVQDTLAGSLKDNREDQAQRLDAMTRSQNNSFAEFRKAIEGDDEISHIANRYNYCDGKSDKAFYERTRWALLEEYRHIEFIY